MRKLIFLFLLALPFGVSAQDCDSNAVHMSRSGNQISFDLATWTQMGPNVGFNWNTGASTPTITVTHCDCYQVWATNSDTTIFSSVWACPYEIPVYWEQDAVVDTASSTTNNILDGGYSKLFPNPFEGVINNHESQKLLIINQIGQTVYSGRDVQISTEKWISGNYFILTTKGTFLFIKE